MLKFIGNGSAFNVERGNNSAYYIDSDKMLLIDCGSNIFERIIKANLLDGINHIDVLVTHTHADHVGSLADLILYMYYSHGELMKNKVTVHSPSGVGVGTLLRLNGVINGIHYIKESLTEAKALHIESLDIDVIAMETEHVEEIESFGYLLDIENNTLLYSGDTNYISKDVFSAFNREIDYLYIDTCKADYEGNVHLSLRVLSETIEQEYRNRVYCMHLDNGFDVDEAELLGFNVTKNIFE